jgi:hypothetical protein
MVDKGIAEIKTNVINAIITFNPLCFIFFLLCWLERTICPQKYSPGGVDGPVHQMEQ